MPVDRRIGQPANVAVPGDLVAQGFFDGTKGQTQFALAFFEGVDRSSNWVPTRQAPPHLTGEITGGRREDVKLDPTARSRAAATAETQAERIRDRWIHSPPTGSGSPSRRKELGAGNPSGRIAALPAAAHWRFSRSCRPWSQESRPLPESTAWAGSAAASGTRLHQ